MAFKIIGIANDSDPMKEYVLLKATDESNELGGYAIVDKTFTSTGNESNKFRHIFRFPSKSIPKGELVSLRTGIGRSEVITNDNNETIHRFYWNSKECIWNDAGDEAILIKYSIQDRFKY